MLRQQLPILINTACPDFDPWILIDRAEAHGLSIIPSQDGPLSIVTQGADPRDLSRQTIKFGWHKDGLYRPALPQLVFLHCQNPGRGDIQTKLGDACTAASSLAKNMPLDLREFALIYEGKNGGLFPRPLIEAHSRTGQLTVNVSQRAVIARPDSPEDRQAAAAESRNMMEQIEGYLDAACIYTQTWRAGDLLIFDNEHFAHARIGSRPDPARRLHRIWFSIESGTP